MALRAFVERALAVVVEGVFGLFGCAFAVVAGEALGGGAVVRKGDESLFAGEKERFAGVGEIGVAVVAAEALGGVQLVVKDHRARRAARDSRRVGMRPPAWTAAGPAARMARKAASNVT